MSVEDIDTIVRTIESSGQEAGHDMSGMDAGDIPSMMSADEMKTLEDAPDADYKAS